MQQQLTGDDKKDKIIILKRVFVIFIFWEVFVSVLYLSVVQTIPIKPFLIATAFFLVIAIPSTMWAYKHRGISKEKIQKKSKTMAYVFIILGLLGIVIALVKAILSEVSVSEIITVVFALGYGFYLLKKSN